MRWCSPYLLCSRSVSRRIRAAHIRAPRLPQGPGRAPAARAAKAGAVAQVQAGRAAPARVRSRLVQVLAHTRPQARAAPRAALAAQRAAARALAHRLVRPLVPAAVRPPHPLCWAPRVRRAVHVSKGAQRPADEQQPCRRAPRPRRRSGPGQPAAVRPLRAVRWWRRCMRRRACRSGTCGRRSRGCRGRAPRRTSRGAAARGTARAPRSAARGARAPAHTTPWGQQRPAEVWHVCATTFRRFSALLSSTSR